MSQQAVSPERPITSLDLIRLRDMGDAVGMGLSISADGSHVAFEQHQADVERNTYDVAWFVASTLGGHAPVKVADGGEPLLYRRMDDSGAVNGAWLSEKAVWSPDGKWIFYRKQTNGEVQLWRSRIDGSLSQQITHNPADVLQFWFSKDGGKMLFTVDVSREKNAEIELRQAREGHLFDLNDYWSTLRARPLNRRYRLLKGKPELWVWDRMSGAELPATAAEAADFQATGAKLLLPIPQRSLKPRVVIRSERTGFLAWLEPAYADQQGVNPPLTLFYSDSAGKHAIHCSVKPCTGLLETSGTLNSGLWWNAEGTQIYFVRKDGINEGTRSLYRWDTRSHRVVKILTTDDALTDCALAGRRAMCFRETVRQPRTIVELNLETAAIRTLVDPNPEFAGLRRGAATRLEWSDAQNHATYGYLIKPIDYQPGRRYPLIIVSYRAKRAGRGGTGDEYPVQVFAANGFAVLAYDLPYLPDAETRAINAREYFASTWGGDKPLLRITLALLDAAVDLLDKQGIIDPQRVGITGFSNGASVAGFALSHSRKYAAASFSMPPPEPIGYYISGGGSGSRQNMRDMGLGPAGHGWPDISLSENLNRLQAPILINSADNEYLWGMQTVVAHAEAGKPTEMHVYADEYHVKWYPAHRYSIYERNVDWFNFWLRQTESSAVEKSAQYRRWRSLRVLTTGEPTVNNFRPPRTVAGH